jgi:hypothetical protein
VYQDQKKQRQDKMAAAKVLRASKMKQVVKEEREKLES